jgi:hypothetical protein
LEEFREALQDQAVVQQFLELGIAKYEADDFFACLDLDGNEELSVTEFVEGCLRVHGSAQSKHLLQVQYDINRARDTFRIDLSEVHEYIRWIIRNLSGRYGPGRAAGAMPENSGDLHGAFHTRLALPPAADGGQGLGTQSSPEAHTVCAKPEREITSTPATRTQGDEENRILKRIHTEQLLLTRSVEEMISEVRSLQKQVVVAGMARQGGESEAASASAASVGGGADPLDAAAREGSPAAAREGLPAVAARTSTTDAPPGASASAGSGGLPSRRRAGSAQLGRLRPARSGTLEW